MHPPTSTLKGIAISSAIGNMGRKQRMKDKKKDLKTKNDELFKILASEVFLKRLPAKLDIASCRCVCKKWRSFLSTPEFTRTHLQNQVTIDDYKLLLVDESEPSYPYRTLSLDQTLPPFDPDHDLKTNPEPIAAGASIIGSLDGLVCLAVRTRDGQMHPTLLFMNPFTGACKRLPPIPNGDGYFILLDIDPIAFYFDSCNNDYRLVRIFYDRLDGAAVYSHKMGSWRHIEFSVPGLGLDLDLDIHGFSYWSPPMFYGQCVYFQVICLVRDDDEQVGFHRLVRMISFDVKTEKFKQVPPLANATATDFSWAGLVVLKGCLHLYVSYSISDVQVGVDVWRRMKDDDEWVQVDAFERQLQKQPQHLILTETTGDWLAVLDQRDNSFKKMSTEEFTTRYPCFSFSVKGYTHGRMIYAETLVNP